MSDRPADRLSDVERGWVAQAIGRKRLFLALSAVGVAFAISLTCVSAWQRMDDPSYALGPRAVIVILILLNARQNLRQRKYALVLEKLTGDEPSTELTGTSS